MKINWNKLYSITAIAAVACAAIGWSVDKAIEYAPLPGQVADHERRISALEAQSATNAVRLDDRLRDIDRDLKIIFRKMDAYSPDASFTTNQGYAAGR